MKTKIYKQGDVWTVETGAYVASFPTWALALGWLHAATMAATPLDSYYALTYGAIPGTVGANV